MSLRIGIDVGGTNTDAVLIDGVNVVAGFKTTTSPDIMSGVLAALKTVLSAVDDRRRITAVMIGTTQFLNAVIERRDLTAVAAIRIALPTAARVPPFADWPADLRAIVSGATFMIHGGHEVDGRRIVPLDLPAIQAAARAVREAGIGAVGITAAFSPITAADELAAAEIFWVEAPGVAITCSHRLGRIGLLARENVTLLNASLCALAEHVIAGLERAVRESGIGAPLFITQNDGTLTRAETAKAYPVLCFGSGPTNSLRGAASLSGLSNAIVIDVGGTTSDVGVLHNNFPREGNNVLEIGGVRTMFRMPDTISVGLGGGTLVNPQDPVDIGPASVGYRLDREALVQGGNMLTCTDVAVAAGLVDLGDRARVKHLSAGFVDCALRRIRDIAADTVDRVRSNAADLPLVAVGGASFLVPDSMVGVSRVVRVEEPGIANAVGAAMAQVSGEVDQVFEGLTREQAIATARELAERRATEAGAAPQSLSLVEAEDLPMAYMPGNMLRVRVRVAGSIDYGADTSGHRAE